MLYFDYNSKSSVLLIFFFNAILFSCLIFIKGLHKDKRESRWLAAFIFLGGLYICPFMLGYANWYAVEGYRAFLFFIPFQQLLLIGPVFYFYNKALLYSDFQLSWKDGIHFILPALYLCYSLIVFVVDSLVLPQYYFYADGQDQDLDFWYQMAGLISMLYYLYRSLQAYKKYRKLSLQEVSFADDIAFTWIRDFNIAFTTILVLRVLFFILNPEWGEFGRKYWYYLCFSILLLYISISGYSNTLITTIKLKLRLLPSPEVPQVGVHDERPLDPNDAAALHSWKTNIIQLFASEEIFRNPNLTLTDLANLLGTNRNIVSKVINREFKMNFNDFINEKRTEAVISVLHTGVHHQVTLLGIALDCGFNSKTTFNRAFKKYTGVSPKQYISQNML
ncbi:MAG: helix-turn-helix transcriptional regulator [Saprospiraceae bacterium]|nr:helix-turn-helix transcriptional regulator [Saprospiraceae bacterium]